VTVRSRLRSLAAFLAAAQVVASGAQQPQTPSKFTAGTELVRVDFIVSDKAGRLIHGLTQKDFLVKEDGKERPIVSFEAFAPIEAPAAPAISADPATAPPASARPIRSSTVLLIDDVHLSVEQIGAVRPAIKQLLTTVAGRNDLLALVAPASSITIAGELPGSGPQLAAAVDRITGHRVEENPLLPVLDAEAIAILRGDLEVKARVAQRFVRLNPTMSVEQAAEVAIERSGDVNHTARTRREAIYATATQALTWLSDKPGRHSVVIVSGGWAKDPSDPAYNALVTRSLRVNAPIHFIDARGLPGGSMFKSVEYGAALGRNSNEGPNGRADAAEGTVNLADDSGGLIVENTNDFEKGLTRILDTMQAYYVIGYEAPPHTGKPGFHKIQVEVKTKGVSVRARRGYYDLPAGR
jgi:VWFA-related protein